MQRLSIRKRSLPDRPSSFIVQHPAAMHPKLAIKTIALLLWQTTITG
jgi:hypothetical protein